MLKKNLRKNYLERRMRLPPHEVQVQSNQILHHFNLLSFPDTRFLLSYYPLIEQNEFDVSGCDREMCRKYPAIQIAWPKISIGILSMDAYLPDKDNLFIKNKYNILEPLEGVLLEPQLIEIIFIPLLAVDFNGYRVGYGKGFYDRYLPRCRPDVIKVGFSFFDAVDTISDIDEFDVPLNFCITPTRIYEF